MKRTRLKRSGFKTPKVKRAQSYRMRHTLTERTNWLAQWLRCWWCESNFKLTVHHISKRSHGGEWEQPANWFCACAVCNCGVLDWSDKATQAKALVLKRKHDPDNFDLAKWNEIHTGGKGERISLADVDAAEHELP